MELTETSCFVDGLRISTYERLQGSERVTNETTVVIIGAGVAGLSLALFLQDAGVAFVVLELHDRSRVESRHRAGFLDAEAVSVFARRGMIAMLPERPRQSHFVFRLDGIGRQFDAPDDDSTGRFCTQQELVSNLLHELVDVRGCDVRFCIEQIAVDSLESERPQLDFLGVDGPQKLTCKYIAGCDGGHSVSRSFIPAGVLKEYTHEFGYAWLAALVEAPVRGPAITAVSKRGYAGHFPRGLNLSRIYLQCQLSDGIEDWPDARIWEELNERCGGKRIMATIREKNIVPIRAVMFTPMQYGRLFLLGDAAHLVPPTAAKGMSLALRDVDVLADALVTAIREADEAHLAAYSDAVLPGIWKEQENSASMTETYHDAGDPAGRGEFRWKLARVRLEEFFVKAEPEHTNSH